MSELEIINTYKNDGILNKDIRFTGISNLVKEKIEFEAYLLIARITLSFLAYNFTSYINRINNEPQTLGNLFRDLECQLANPCNFDGTIYKNIRNN